MCRLLTCDDHVSGWKEGIIARIETPLLPISTAVRDLYLELFKGQLDVIHIC